MSRDKTARIWDATTGEEQSVLTTPHDHLYGVTFSPDGQYLLVDDVGVASCWDVKTGKQFWKERLSGKKHHASAVAADGRVYLTSDEGVTFVLKAENEFEVLAKNPLGEPVFSSPAFSDGDIFIRGAKHLWCIGK